MSESLFQGPKYSAWKAAVAEARTKGLNQEAAIIKVDRDQPGLREAMIQETNERRATRA